MSSGKEFGLYSSGSQGPVVIFRQVSDLINSVILKEKKAGCRWKDCVRREGSECHSQHKGRPQT